MTTRGWGAVLALTASLALAGSVQAQQRPPGDRARMEEEVRQRFEQLMFRELGLDEESGRVVAETLRSFRPARAELAQRRRRLQRRMEGTGALLAEDEAREVLAGLAGLAREEADLLVQEQSALLEILSPPQVVRLYGLREAFGARLRQLRDRRGPGGSPGGGMGRVPGPTPDPDRP